MDDLRETIVRKLIDKFNANREAFLDSGYNETSTRIDFIDPFFEALGWDVRNEKGKLEKLREVVHEDRVSVRGRMKAPDYSFRLGRESLFP